MKFDQDLYTNFWYDLKKFIMGLNPLAMFWNDEDNKFDEIKELEEIDELQQQQWIHWYNGWQWQK